MGELEDSSCNWGWVLSSVKWVLRDLCSGLQGVDQYSLRNFSNGYSRVLFPPGLYPEGKILQGCKLTEIQVKKEIKLEDRESKSIRESQKSRWHIFNTIKSKRREGFVTVENIWMKSTKSEGKWNLHKNEIQKNYQIPGTVVIQKMSIRKKRTFLQKLKSVRKICSKCRSKL